MRTRRPAVILSVLALVAVAACAPTLGPDPDPAYGYDQGLGAAPSTPPGVPPAVTSPTAPARTPAPPSKGDGTFGTAPTGPRTIGSGETLVRYRVEVEKGISWGDNQVWKPSTFATAVDRILAAPRGWTRSASAPVTSSRDGVSGASWSFRRVGAGTGYDVRIRLATPSTVDLLCGQAGMDTEGKYSCRFGSTVMINLGRWLNGAPGYRVPIADYRTNVINHELGHFLGFGHATCPGRGRPAPVMQTQTIDLGGCVPNPYPFGANGRFVTGPRG